MDGFTLGIALLLHRLVSNKMKSGLKPERGDYPNKKPYFDVKK